MEAVRKTEMGAFTNVLSEAKASVGLTDWPALLLSPSESVFLFCLFSGRQVEQDTEKSNNHPREIETGLVGLLP